MKQPIWFAAVCAIAGSVFGQAVDLVAAKFQHDSAITVIHSTRLEADRHLASLYTNALHTLRVRAQNDGDLDRLKPVLAEAERYAREHTPPVAPFESADLQKLATSFVKYSRDLAVKEAADILKQTAQYEAALAALQVALTRSGLVEKATAVQEERKALVPVVAAARAVLGAEAAPAPPQPAVAKTTAAPPAWKPLSDGRRFSGWNQTDEKGWRIEDGAFVCESASLLMTEHKFKNFELELEWRMDAQANGGIYYAFGNEDPNDGPHLQLCYAPTGRGRQFLTGGLLGVLAPTTDAARPAGTWNSARLLVNGRHREHWINETKVLSYDLNDPDYQDAVKASKFRDTAGLKSEQTGAIALQSMTAGPQASYRNIRIRELPSSP